MKLRALKPGPDGQPSNDPYLVQQHAFVTYMSKQPTKKDSLEEAHRILQTLDPEKTGDPATLGLWGGTLLQWLVPFLLASYFFYHRQFASFIFCAFFFFENWIYTATYMGDARAMVLPLVTLGDPEFAKHDWNTIFGNLGVLDYDTRIAAVVRFLGWTGMLACTARLANRLREAAIEPNSGPIAATPRSGSCLLREV